MANHGYCKNCWYWWHVVHTNITPFSREVGICYFQRSGKDYKHETFEDSYCPDYLNRKVGNRKQTLQQFVSGRLFEFL